MSVNVLHGGEGYKHTFQDYMESFFYVVLYAAVRWLPHNDVDNLGNLMYHYFNEYREHNGKPKGGSLKSSNITFGDFTNEFKWENEHLARWIEKALEFQQFFGREKPGWTVENLQKLWEDIDSTDLPNDDRVEHKIVLALEEIKEGEIQATSASVHVQCGPSGQISGQISGVVSSVQIVSAFASSSRHSLGKRSASDIGGEGSEESGMSRNSKRRRPLRVERSEGNEDSRQLAGTSITSTKRVLLRVKKGRRRKSKE